MTDLLNCPVAQINKQKLVTIAILITNKKSVIFLVIIFLHFVINKLCKRTGKTSTINILGWSIFILFFV